MACAQPRLGRDGEARTVIGNADKKHGAVPRALVALGALTCLLACSASTPGSRTSNTPPRVVRFEPSGPLDNDKGLLRILFDHPMVDVDAVGPTLAAPPLELSPALPIDAHWTDRTTLVVRPRDAWKSGDRYRLSLTAALGELAGEREHTFDVEPLRLSWLGVPERNAPRTPKFHANFSRPVKPEEVAQRCELRDKDDNVAKLHLPEPYPDRDEPEERVRLEVREPLALATHYRFVCSGLLPVKGSAPLYSDEARGFTTHGPPELLGIYPSGDVALPPEKARVCLSFATPVDPDELGKHIDIAPRPEGLAESFHYGACDDDNKDLSDDRASAVLLAPNQTYTITVNSDLEDRFGQRLGETHRATFRTRDRVPGLWTATGLMAVLERGRRGHAVGTLNMPLLSMRCAPLSPPQLAANLASLRRWVYDYGQGDDPDDYRDVDPASETRAKDAFAFLDLKPRAEILGHSTAPNRAARIALDLGASCGKGSAAPGLYLLELSPRETLSDDEPQGDDPARLLSNVTDLAVVAKRGRENAVVWVTRFSDGGLVAGADVRALSVQGVELARARTDAMGLARIAALPASDGDVFFAVATADDLAVVGTDWLWRDGLEGFQLGVNQATGDQSRRLFVYSDRGVYRPGEKVLVHGLARTIRDRARARVPLERAVELALEVDGNRMLERSLSLSDYGSFHAELELPAAIPPGSHPLTVTAGGTSDVLPIKVAEFRPVSFEITGGPTRDETLSGEEARVAIEARYLFGAVLPNAELAWTVIRRDAAVRAPRFSEFSFADHAPALPDESRWPQSDTGVVDNPEGRTDKNGKAAITFPTEAPSSPGIYTVTVEARDRGEDRVSKSFSVLTHSAERYVGVRFSRWLFGAEEPISAEVVLVDRDGEPVAGQAEVELREVRWQCSDPYAGCTSQVRQLEKRSLAVARGKPANLTFNTAARGSVYVRATVQDAGGRRARASDSAWATGAGAEAAPYNDRVAAELSVDRRRYKVGQRARLALQTPLSPRHYLLTSERSDVLSARVIATSEAPPSIALGADAAPNVFVGMTGMVARSEEGEAGKPRLVAGARELQVQGASRALSVQIALGADTYEPGQRVRGEVAVAHLGAPVAAEVAVVVVNESVLQLTGFATPDPTAVFHRHGRLGVVTASNITQVIADPARAADVPEVARMEGEEEGGTDGKGGRPPLRDDYVAAAFWAPALRTGTGGKASFAFDAPGDLSAYRVMAVAAAKDDRVGSGERRMTVRKPLSAKLLAPRFASRGDSLELGALFHDHTGETGPVVVKLQGEGLALAQRELSVASAGDAGELARTSADVGDVDRASFEVEVHKGDHSDRVQRELRVRRPLDTELRVLAAHRARAVAAELRFPAGSLEELSQAQVTIDRAGLASLAPLLVRVVDYPYGCTEQTLAALAALIATPELAAAILPGQLDRARIAERIAEGQALVLRAQAADGHFGFYPGMGGRPFLTALALEAAIDALQAGFDAPKALVEDAGQALRRYVKGRAIASMNPAQRDLAARATALFSRQGAPELATEDELYALRDALPDSALAYLLRAYAERGAHAERQKELTRRLAEEAWLSLPRDLSEPLRSPTATSALVLRALVAAKAPEAQQARLVKRLKANAEDPDHYWSTRDIAETLGALAAWAKRSQSGSAQVEVGCDDKALWQGTLEGAAVVHLARSAAELACGKLWVKASEDVSVAIRRKDVSDSRPKPAFSRGLALKRRYLDPKTGKPLEKVALGDIVQVVLEVSAEQATAMVAISDPLPAGLEPLDPGLVGGSLAGCERCDGASASIDHVRRRDDRIEAFAERLHRGTHTVRYLLRATTAGRFSAPGATALAMYAPNVFGRSEVGRIAVVK